MISKRWMSIATVLAALAGPAAAAGQELCVLQGVDLSLPDGEFLTLMGPSGNGKTTVLNIMSGLDVPSSGSVNCIDRVIDRLDPAPPSVPTGAQPFKEGFLALDWNDLPLRGRDGRGRIAFSGATVAAGGSALLGRLLRSEHDHP